ncbi:hypothetical protein CDL15_Pgr008100 [Punica granatum]|uniref:Uncharacterized protein n=1 Tax=Punica granatum TaxID=22663 RepID=A0A218W3W2_PUNGR|nr:hypothetical protein CDL15_Pgr008100 [Punica granatum]PKI36291.1 hypothetical protein CRG98_043317 [Punica granatum]
MNKKPTPYSRSEAGKNQNFPSIFFTNLTTTSTQETPDQKPTIDDSTADITITQKAKNPIGRCGGSATRHFTSQRTAQNTDGWKLIPMGVYTAKPWMNQRVTEEEGEHFLTFDRNRFMGFCLSMVSSSVLRFSGTFLGYVVDARRDLCVLQTISRG